MNTCQPTYQRLQRCCRRSKMQLSQQPFAAVVRLTSSSKACSSSNSSSRLAHGTTQGHYIAAKQSVLRTKVIVCSSASSSTKHSKIASNRSSKATGPSASNSSTTSASSTVVAAAVAAASVVAAPTATVTIANPPLGFSGSSSKSSQNNIVSNIVSATPLVNPGSRNPAECSSDEDLEDTGAASGFSTSRQAAYRCLILDSRYLPVNVVSWARAVVMDFSGKVDVLEYHPGGYAYSAYKAHPLPAVLRVRTFVDVHEFAGKLSLTRKNVVLRDHQRCQYCGSSKDLTLDHIVPVCRGGINSWTNLVTACMTCNQKKGDRSLAQMGWKLPKIPREPSPSELGVIAGINKSDMQNPPLPWLPYLATYMQMLEKAQTRATRDLQQHAADTKGTYSSSGGRSNTVPDLVTVTFHPAGPKSKAAKAAAVAAVSGSSKSKVRKG